MEKKVLILSVLLALLPFLWFAPGVINLGGDSSRLYFYDPLSFLQQFAIYNVIPSESGFEHVPYYFIPFTLLLVFVQWIVQTPHLLIVVYYSFMVVTCFLSVTFIIDELLKEGENTKNETWKVFAAIVGGLFYTLSPILGPNWDKNLISHNQIFLNPLVFFLILKFINTNRMVYGYALVITTILFAPGFSFSSAPPFFAFYPIATFFFICYAIFSKKRVSYKKVLAIIILLILTHLFHIGPQISNLLDVSSNYNTRVFSDKSALEGLVYFDSVRVGVRLSKNIIPLIQTVKPLFVYDWILFLFPVMIVLGILYNARKNVSYRLRQNYILLLGCLLITLFFASANITPLISSVYRLMFHIPGFSMFRNYYGQFMYVHYFYYALVLGFALYLIFYFSSRRIQIILTILAVGVLTISGWTFLSGASVNQPFYQGKENVDGTFKMDKDYEEVLNFFRNDQIDGRVLLLPVTDFGYQVLGGEGGYYIGPSMIGYLTGKKDFAGYKGFLPFDEELLTSARARDYARVAKVLSLFNIRYIFHNTDDAVYSREYFEGFPYQTVREYMPDTQESYTDFIAKLPVSFKEEIGSKYKIYEVNKESYLPHIYASGGITFVNDDKVLLPPAELKNDNKLPSYFYSENAQGVAVDSFSSLILSMKSQSPYKVFTDKRRDSIFPNPHVSHYFSSPLYRFVVNKEKEEQRTLLEEKKFDDYFDYSLQVALKRLVELQRWGSSIDVIGNIQSIQSIEENWEEPKLWHLLNFNAYNYWEVSLVRYKRTIDSLIDETIDTNDSLYQVEVNKLSLAKELAKHKETFITTLLYTSSFTREQKIYLYNIAVGLFDSLQNRLTIDEPTTQSVAYEIESTRVPLQGRYKVYVERAALDNFNTGDINLDYEGRLLLPHASQLSENWIRYEDIVIDSNEKIGLTLKPLKEVNLSNAKDTWQQLENIQVDKEQSSIELAKPEINLSGGVIKEISNWTSGAYYKLSFEYHTHDEPFRIRLIEQSEELGEPVYTVIFDDSLRSPEWARYIKVLPPSTNIQPRLLQIAKDTDQSNSEEVIQTEKKTGKVDFRKLSVLQVPHPQILLVKETESARELPQITFTKINPTKYRISVKDAVDPYTLVFLEAFSPNWKLYPLGTSGQAVSSLDTYFDGQVIEGVPVNMFFSQNTFETRGLNALEEKNHFQLNGYANGWIVNPDAVGNKNEYDLILEMSTQNLLYPTLAISALAFCIVLVLYGIEIFKIFFRR